MIRLYITKNKQILHSVIVQTSDRAEGQPKCGQHDDRAVLSQLQSPQVARIVLKSVNIVTVLFQSSHHTAGTTTATTQLTCAMASGAKQA